MKQNRPYLIRRDNSAIEFGGTFDIAAFNCLAVSSSAPVCT